MSCGSSLKCHNASFTGTSSGITVASRCKNTLWDTLTQVEFVFVRSLAPFPLYNSSLLVLTGLF